MGEHCGQQATLSAQPTEDDPGHPVEQQRGCPMTSGVSGGRPLLSEDDQRQRAAL